MILKTRPLLIIMILFLICISLFLIKKETNHSAIKEAQPIQPVLEKKLTETLTIESKSDKKDNYLAKGISDKTSLDCVNSDDEFEKLTADYNSSKLKVLEPKLFDNSLIGLLLPNQALDTESAKQHINNLKKYVNNNPLNKMAAWQLLTLCTQERNSEFCDSTIEESAITIDRENANVWLSIATLRASRSDTNGVINALNEFIAAPNYTAYWSEYFRLYYQALTLLGDIDFKLKSTASYIFVIGLNTPEVRPLFKLCQNYNEGYSELLQLCLAAAKKMGTESKTRLDIGLGLALERNIYRLINNNDLFEEADRKYKKHRKEWSNKKYLHMLKNESLMMDWLERIDSNGEQATMQYIDEESNRLLAEEETLNLCEQI